MQDTEAALRATVDPEMGSCEVPVGPEGPN